MTETIPSQTTAPVTIDIAALYAATGTAKLASIPAYESESLALCPPGGTVVLTGRGPVWLYLRLAHALHGKARSLSYESPEAGLVEIFNHSSH